jgi:hypothetical protein
MSDQTGRSDVCNCGQFVTNLPTDLVSWLESNVGSIDFDRSDTNLIQIFY